MLNSILFFKGSEHSNEDEVDSFRSNCEVNLCFLHGMVTIATIPVSRKNHGGYYHVVTKVSGNLAEIR